MISFQIKVNNPCTKEQDSGIDQYLFKQHVGVLEIVVTSTMINRNYIYLNLRLLNQEKESLVWKIRPSYKFLYSLQVS